MTDRRGAVFVEIEIVVVLVWIVWIAAVVAVASPALRHLVVGDGAEIEAVGDGCYLRCLYALYREAGTDGAVAAGVEVVGGVLVESVDKERCGCDVDDGVVWLQCVLSVVSVPDGVFGQLRYTLRAVLNPVVWSGDSGVDIEADGGAGRERGGSLWAGLDAEVVDKAFTSACRKIAEGYETSRTLIVSKRYTLSMVMVAVRAYNGVYRGKGVEI